MIDGREVERLLPELKRISSPGLRRKVRTVWRKALKMGGWERPMEVPFSLNVPGTSKGLIQHTRDVAELVIAVASGGVDIDLDIALAGAILHDVGKLLEMGRDYGHISRSEVGALVGHAAIGAALAVEAKIPWEVVHIIISHSPSTAERPSTPEAIVVHHCDYICFEMELLSVK